MSEKYDTKNYSSKYQHKTKHVCNPIDCYFSNENADFCNCDAKDEKENDCPFCAYNYESRYRLKSNVDYELEQNKISIKNIFRSEFLFLILKIFVSAVVVASIVYFYLKNILIK